MRVRRFRPVPRSRVVTTAVCAVTIALALASCSGSDADDAAAEPTTTERSTSAESTTSSTSTTVLADQTPPVGANGIKVADDGSLWIASLASDVVLNVDAASGTILRRVATPPGSGPDDVAVADDGTVFWTGWLSGDVGRIAPDSEATAVVANVGVGANPIALRSDGMLVVGRAGGVTGLYAVDPDGDPGPVALADPGNLNSFSSSPTGQFFAPDLATASVVEVDPDTGELVRVVAPVDGAPVGVRWHDGELFVLVLSDAARVFRVDPSTGDVALFGETGLEAADNLAVGRGGTVYVTGLSVPSVTVLGADGVVERTVSIGG